MTEQRVQPEFEVEELEGEFEQTVYRVVETEHDGLDGKKVKKYRLEQETVRRKCGYMVYFPQGHSIHVTSKEELMRLGFHTAPNLVDMDTGDVVPQHQPTSLKQQVNQKTRKGRNRQDDVPQLALEE